MHSEVKDSDGQSRMRLIYRGAKTVRIWLGEKDDRSGLALQFAKRISKMSQSTTAQLIQEATVIDIEALMTLGEIFSRPYWRRVWVVQEIICAKDIIVHCGPYSISWSDLSTASTQLNNNQFYLAVMFHTRLGLVGDLIRGGPASLKLGTGFSGNGGSLQGMTSTNFFLLTS